MDEIVNIENILTNIANALKDVGWATWGYATIYTIAGFLSATFVSTLVGRILSRYTSAHYTQLARRVFYYGILGLFVVMALITLHLDAKVLGIATVLTIALGFASQTAVSNTISGLFLVFERPFVVGDHMNIEGVTGELLSIDLLSIKLRTFNNEFIRIPNENLLKVKFVNLTRFPIRRVSIVLKVSLQEDFEKVKKILFDIAEAEPLVLHSPNPTIFFEGFGEYYFEFKYIFWTRAEIFLTVKTKVALQIQKSFRENSILMPISQHYFTGDINNQSNINPATENQEML